MYHQASQRSAALPGGAGSGENDGARRQLKVSRGGDDGGVVAAELEQRTAKAGSDPLTHSAAHFGAAGGADERDGAVTGQLLADGAIADRKLRKAGRGRGRISEYLLEQPVQGERTQRRLVRWFPDNRIPAHQRQRRVPGPDGHRKVEGADHG